MQPIRIILLPMLTAASLALLLGLFPHCASANGYEVYASPLAWSPDSLLLAATVGEAWPQDGELLPGEMRLYTRSGRYQILAAADSLGSPSFSADSRRLAFIHDGWLVVHERQDDGSWLGGDYYNGALDCRFGWLVGAPVMLITSGERFYGCSVSSFDLTALSIGFTFTGPAGGSLFAPLSVPDGSALLCLMQYGFEGNGPAYERIVSVDPSSGAWTLLCQPEAREWDYHESNVVFVDADTFLFQRGGWGDWRLYRYELAEGREYLELSDAQQPSLSADGRWLAFTRRDPQLKAEAEYDWEIAPTVWLRDRQRGIERQVSGPGMQAEFPALSPDGTKLAWLQMGTTAAVELVLRSRPSLLLR